MNIKEKLCHYDKRNPDCVELDEDDVREDGECWCGNCFRGVTELAEIVLNRDERIKELEAENKRLHESRCPVEAMQCEYSRVFVECVTDIECPHKLDESELLKNDESDFTN